MGEHYVDAWVFYRSFVDSGPEGAGAGLSNSVVQE
jgi:hypothetical protein